MRAEKVDRFVWASRKGDVATVRALLQDGQVHVNSCDRFGDTALHYAAKNGHLRVVQLLLDAHADPNITDEIGETPLHLASIGGDLQIVESLLEAHADLHAAAMWGQTPLHAACQCHDSDIARALLAAGADLHATTKDGHKPLHLCISQSGYHQVTAKTLKTLQVLVSFGATWDATHDELFANGETFQEARALHTCVSLWTQERADGHDSLTEIPIETVLRGVISTQAYINDLKTSQEIVLRRKICVVGSSCAGKTSFVKSITAEQPQLEHVDDRTIGIDHFPLRFQESSSSSDETKIHEVTFWDFAGQDAYQVAHSLFFSPRTLFLVCVGFEAFTTAVLQASIMSDVEKQETQLMDEFIERTVMQWIRLIVARQPDAEFVFVATKEDLIQKNHATEQLFKARLTAKLKEVDATVQQMRDQLKKDKRLLEIDTLTVDNEMADRVATSEPTIVFASCTSHASVHAARARIEELIIESKRSFSMPDTYSQALKAIVAIREAARSNGITSRISRVFAPVDTLPAQLKIEPELCRTILQTLHDLGDVLWYDKLGVELFENTVILDPLLLIDFIRQVINHNHTGVIMSHHDLKSKPFWIGLSSEHHMKAMKQVLQEFHLVYSDDQDGLMHWDSDLIVPAFWQTKTPAAWLFLGDILRINSTKSLEGEAVRVEWEYHFEFGLPPSLFDHLVVASVSPYFKFDAGPDWIVYEEKGIAACRIMIGRDPKSLHRTIHVEAVAAEAASKKQVDKLWKTFRHLCGAFVGVMREYPGLAGVSSFAWDDQHTKINLKRLLRLPSDEDAATWMPPESTWTWFQQLVSKSA